MTITTGLHCVAVDDAGRVRYVFADDAGTVVLDPEALDGAEEGGASPKAAGTAWDSQAHPRIPSGRGGGRFTHSPGGSPAGDIVAPGVKQLTLPGAPDRPPPGSSADKTAAALERALRSDHERDVKPGELIEMDQPEGVNFFGNTADTDVVTYADGTRWIRKRGIGEDSINREIAYSRVAAVFGVPAPQVVKRQRPDGTWELHEPYVENGQTAIEWTGGIDEAAARQMGLAGGDRDPQDMYDSPGGRLIGLADKATQASATGTWATGWSPKARTARSTRCRSTTTRSSSATAPTPRPRSPTTSRSGSWPPSTRPPTGTPGRTAWPPWSPSSPGSA